MNLRSLSSSTTQLTTSDRSLVGRLTDLARAGLEAYVATSEARLLTLRKK
jgi:hypothetical protein